MSISLTRIRERYAKIDRPPSPTGGAAAAYESAQDVPVLVAELERLATDWYRRAEKIRAIHATRGVAHTRMCAECGAGKNWPCPTIEALEASQ